MTGTRRALIAAATALAALALAPAAGAAVPSVLGGAVDCNVEADGVRFCGGSETTVPTFDGVPIDVNVALPPEPATGPDGDYPLVGMYHGWGGSELGLGSMRRFADRGYAVFSMSDRGWGHSCGGQSPTRFTLPCLQGGHNRLLDTRYEVRDAQEFAGRLVDEGLVDPQRIGSIGGSYGGGMSMSLGALRDRKMLPDGTLVPWTSPQGTPMRIAATTPEIPWTDLAYSLTPNGRTLDYVADAPYTPGPIGVLKQSFVAGLYGTGQASSNYAAPGTDPDADLNNWYAFLNAGEPYDQSPLAADIVDEVTTHHSSYYIDPSTPPAPMLISNGWTDDLFPPDEAIRFYNRTHSLHPGADISLMFLDYGHQRGQNKSADTALLRAKEDAWFDHYLKDEGTAPTQGVTTLTQTCPSSAASAGPYTAASWADIAPGEIRFTDAAPKVIAPAAGDPAVARAFDPIAGGGACASTSSADQPGTATYRLDPAPAGGYTLMGLPTVLVDIASPSPTSQVAARLLDVAPGGTQTLVGRALYRPASGVDATRQVFQLHPNGWRFEPGHVAKLELLPNDAPYGRASNGQGPVTVSNLELRLPVLEEPGTGPALEPAPKFVPDGYTLAPGYLDIDSDGDGIVDEDDDCPDAPGPASNAGCPLLDTDGDGVPDVDDECDDEPGPASNQGCPEDPVDDDADDDGVLDSQDACPDVPGPAENAGCPIPTDDDADDDGVPDAEDDCPDVAGPIENGGCPVTPATCTTGIQGTPGDDRLRGSALSELIRGRAGDDRIRAKAGPDCVRGGPGEDLARGGSGEDVIRGGSGDDRLQGGRDDDLLEARGRGVDVVRCGAGDDEAVVDDKDSVSGCETVRRR